MPSRKDCIDEILESIGKRKSREWVEEGLDDIDDRAREYEDRGWSRRDAYRKAADERLDREARRAALARKEERENAAKQIAEQRRIDTLRKEKGISPRLTMEAMTVGVNTPFYKSQGSMAANWTVYKSKWLGHAGLEGMLERMGLLKVFRNRVIEDQWGEELAQLTLGRKGAPGITKNAQALDIAKAVFAVQNQAIADHNRAGGHIESYGGHVSKMLWDSDKVRKAATPNTFERGGQIYVRLAKGGTDADRNAFVADVLQHADLRRTFGSMPAQEIKDALYEMWVPLKNGDHFDYSSPSSDPIYANVAAKAAAHREIHWKSFEDWKAVNAKYGIWNPTEGVVRGLEGLARQTALVERLGTKPTETFDALVNYVKKSTEKGNERQEFDKFEPMLRHQMRQLDGSANKPVYKLGARLTRNWMMWERMSMLGRVFFTHIAGLPTKSAELQYWGVGFTDQYKSLLTGFLRGREGSDKRELEHLLWTDSDATRSDLASAFDSADSAPGMMARAENTFMRLTGVVKLLDNQRFGAQEVMAREAGLRKGTVYGDLDPKLARVFRLFGIEEPEWKALNTVDQWALGRGIDGPAAYLTPEDALRISDDAMKEYLKARPQTFQGALGVTPAGIDRARHDLATSIAAMYSERGRYAMYQPSVRGRAFLFRNTEAGTAGDIAKRLAFQFKQWPLEMVYRTWGRTIHGTEGAGEKIGAVVNLVTASAVFGTLAELVRDSFKGEDALTKLAHDPFKFLMRGLLRSGAGTIAGDYIFGEFDRHGRSAAANILGPTLGKIDDVMDLIHGGGAENHNPWKTRAADLLRITKDNTPFVNLWFTDWAFQYLVLHNLQEMISPGYLARLEQRQKKEQGTGPFLSPVRAHSQGFFPALADRIGIH